MKVLGFIFAIVVFTLTANANVEYFTPTVQSANLGDVKFLIHTQDYKVTYSATRHNYGTRMFAKYETKSNAQLEDYAVVQFIRGCQFNTYVDGGEVKYVSNISRHFFNELVEFKHPEWVIDSSDEDAMYYNVPAKEIDIFKSRHGWYRWNKKKNFEQDGEVLYSEMPPKKESSLYVMDHPGTSFMESGWAKNISLEFKTCLYKTSDIPKNTQPNDLDFAKPLKCFTWASSLIFDHSNGTITRPVGIHPYCTSK